MKTAILLTVLLLGSPEEAKLPAGSAIYSQLTIDVGMVVSDLERSLQFYRDGLGMAPASPPGFDVGGDVARDAGLTDGKPFHVAVLLLGEGPGATRLKLIGFPGAKKSDTSFIHTGLGVRYLTLFVKDLQAVLDRMKARSIPIVAKGPVVLPGGVAIALVRDPDGNFVEFVGRLDAPRAPAAGAFKALFNGKDLQGWRAVKNAVWKVEGGAIVGEQGENSTGGWLLTEKTYGDFELRYKFRISRGANSGIAFRFPGGEKDSPARVGYECQLSEADPNYRTGSIFGIAKAPDGIAKEGEWTEGRIVAEGKKLSTFIGGKLAAAAENDRSSSGYIGLQVHGTALYKGMRVEFKDIEILEK